MDEELRALERAAAGGDAEARAKLERARVRAGVHETPDQVLEALAETNAELRQLQRTFARDGLADFQAWLGALFASEPGLHAVRVRGYTPGFLDGDLCEHSQSVSLRATDEDEEGEQDEDDEGDEGDEGEQEETDAALLAKNALTDERSRELVRAFGEFEPVLEAAHGTDWQLVVRRGRDGAPATKKSSWRCGY